MGVLHDVWLGGEVLSVEEEGRVLRMDALAGKLVLEVSDRWVRRGVEMRKNWRNDAPLGEVVEMLKSWRNGVQLAGEAGLKTILSNVVLGEAPAEAAESLKSEKFG